ncbi:MAG: hypothetical protein KGL26_06440 [Pseudomonadota bacterium]|nr:hypothetical protein [Pseudomonadota bacterium]
MTAIQAAAVQQQLMVAGMLCHDTDNYNAFQINFSKEMVRSDKRLLNMFHRLYGWRKGEDEYNAFKTRLANASSERSNQDRAGYCKEADAVFAAALVPQKPQLADFVAGVTIYDQSPVDSCAMRVAPGLQEAATAPSILPQPNPLRVAALSPAPVVNPATAMPAAVSAPAQTPAAAVPDQAPVQSQATAEKPAQPAKTHGWLSNLFN